MNLDDLKQDWQNQPVSRENIMEIANAVKAKAKSFESNIFWRDVTEITAAVVVLPVFAVMFYMTSGLMRFGAGVVIFGVLEIVAVLLWAQKKDRPLKHDLPVREYCQQELQRVNRQIMLLENALWWYAAPTTLGVLFILLGNPVMALVWENAYIAVLMGAIFMCVILFALGIAVINRRASRKNLHPLRESLLSMIQQSEVE